MKEKHVRVLNALEMLTAPGEWYASFDAIAQLTELTDLREVRRIVRHLARKGFAEYRRGLWTEDGYVAGAGYCITKAGIQALECRSE